MADDQYFDSYSQNYDYIEEYNDSDSGSLFSDKVFVCIIIVIIAFIIFVCVYLYLRKTPTAKIPTAFIKNVDVFGITDEQIAAADDIILSNIPTPDKPEQIAKLKDAIQIIKSKAPNLRLWGNIIASNKEKASASIDQWINIGNMYGIYVSSTSYIYTYIVSHTHDMKLNVCADLDYSTEGENDIDTVAAPLKDNDVLIVNRGLRNDKADDLHRVNRILNAAFSYQNYPFKRWLATSSANTKPKKIYGLGIAILFDFDGFGWSGIDTSLPWNFKQDIKGESWIGATFTGNIQIAGPTVAQRETRNFTMIINAADDIDTIKIVKH